jgi:hypothetical protein
MLKKLLETDAEQQMADYLGLKWLKSWCVSIPQRFSRGPDDRH